MNRNYMKLWALILAAALLITGGVLSAGAAPAGNAAGQSTPTVCVGGMPFGVKFYTEGILVVGFCDVDVNSTGGGTRNLNPARDAGLKMKDVIVKVNGETPLCAATLTQAVEESGGKPITLTVKRCVSRRQGSEPPKTTELTVTVTPVKSVSENRYKTGLWVRDSGAGIGTVTFIMPDTGDRKSVV